MILSPIHGVLPPIITPFRQDGEIDEDAFLSNLDRWNRDDLAGYLVPGSNSEAAFLSQEEKLRLIELTARGAAGGRMVIAGTGCESTRETLRLTNLAARAGAHAALLLTPFYYADQMTDRALIHHFTEVADHAEIPILVYNVPKFTRLNISLEVVRALSAHPKIIGMKDSTGNMGQLQGFRSAVGNDFTIIVGTASAWLPALEVGIRAGILALANCAPNECARVQRMHERGNQEEARKLHERLRPVNDVVTSKFGIAGLKYACDLTGYRGGEVRLPLLALESSQKEEIRASLKRGGLLGSG